MKTFLLIGLTVLAPALASGQFINIRLSVKVITHPLTGNRPPGITDQIFYDAAADANVWKAGYSRGYRFQIAEIVNVGGPTQGGTNGPSKWYGTDPRSEPLWSTFQNEINTDPRYARRTDHVNFYVTTGPSGNPGGACPIPPGESDLIACHGFINGGPWWLNHELGHFFGLPHTFSGESGSPACTPGDDGISDTLPDSNCWNSRDAVANYHYGTTYANLNTSQKAAVENVYFNVMSYHEAGNKDTVEDRMTELQLDREATIANSDRAAFVSGRTRFVSLSGNNASTGLNGTAPKRTVLSAVNASAAAGGDLILLRPGNYNEQISINKSVTLRAPRTGWATVGKP